MDYEKKYKETLDRAKKWYNAPNIDKISTYGNRIIEEIFPELIEPEDEEVRKEIMQLIQGMHDADPRKERWLAWLEKQGQVNKTIISQHENKICKENNDSLTSEDERIRKNLIELFRDTVSNDEIFSDYGLDKTEVLAWLEKQTEQNNNEDVDILHRFSFYSYKDEPNVLYLSGLYVNEEYRNKGIGTKILEVADEVAKSMDCHTIRLKTKKDSDAERLYQTHGYNSLVIEGKDEIWLEKQGEKGVKRNDREIPFSEKEPYEGLTDFERTLADICIGWIGQELGWKQYIKDNADVLLKIAIKKLYSAQDVAFEQKPAELSQSEVTKTSDQVQKPAECRQETKPNGGIVYEDFNEGDGSYKVNLAYLSKPQVDLIEDLVASWQNPTNNTAEWSEEDEVLLKLSLENLTEIKNRFGEDYGRVGGCIDWLKSLKERIQPKQEWSEEDVRNIQDIDSVLFYDKSLPEDTCMRLRNWLESLMHQSHWKPSDEQMEALDIAQEELCSTEYNKPICDLIDSLNKLMEE